MRILYRYGFFQVDRCCGFLRHVVERNEVSTDYSECSSSPCLQKQADEIKLRTKGR